MPMFEPIRQPQGLRVFEKDQEGRSKLAEVMKDVSEKGKGSVVYKGHKITVRRGFAAVADLSDK
jgi:hypothetical protein